MTCKKIPKEGEYLIADFAGTCGSTLWSQNDLRWDLYPEGDQRFLLKDMPIKSREIPRSFKFTRDFPLSYMNNVSTEWLDKEQIWVLKYPFDVDARPVW